MSLEIMILYLDKKSDGMSQLHFALFESKGIELKILLKTCVLYSLRQITSFSGPIKSYYEINSMSKKIKKANFYNKNT